MSKKKKVKNRGPEEALAAAALPASSPWQLPLAALCIVAAGALAYSNSFHGVFLFDDEFIILQNDSVHHLWPVWNCAFATQNITRPLACLTLAANYAISELNPWSYHALNLSVHLLAALTLFGIVRRTLLTARLRERFGAASTPLALAAALLWMLHPLQTQSVTYIIQRCEALMGLFYLLTLYCVIRGFTSPRRGWWHGAAVLSCILGAGCKQVIATAPLVVFLYDGVFLSGSFRAAVKRWKLYAVLAASWIILAATLASVPELRLGGAGFGMKSRNWWEYSRSQPGVLLYYLRLAFWPNPLCLDYAWPVAGRPEEIVPSALAILAMLGATAWALLRRPAWGFCGAWFFLILAPSSSIMPIADLAFEHRMYLSLAALTAGGVCGAYLVMTQLFGRGQRQRISGWIVCAAATPLYLTLGYLTFQRNADYESETRMWQDVVAKRPENGRAHSILAKALAYQGDAAKSMQQAEESLRINPANADAHVNLSFVMFKQGNLDEAVKHCEAALKINPKHVMAHLNLASILIKQGKLDDAARHCEEALRLNPTTINAHLDLADVMIKQGRLDEAIRHCEEELKIRPNDGLPHLKIGSVLNMQGKTDEAIGECELALKINPALANAHVILADILARQGKPDEAVRRLEEAIKMNPNDAAAHTALARMLYSRGEVDAAIKEYETALKANPKSSNARFNLADILIKQGKLGDAARQYEEVLKLNPADALAHSDLGGVLYMQGKLDDAIQEYEAALNSDPAHAEAHYNLALALERKGQADAAIAHYGQALKLKPGYQDARNKLERLKH